MGISITATDQEVFFAVVLGLIALPWGCLWGYIGWRLAARHDERSDRAQFEPDRRREHATVA